MSLSATLNIGRSALTASQIGLQVAGNNMANAATPGYTRQLAILEPLRGQTLASGIQMGMGVGVSDVRRQVDGALQSRVWDSTANDAAAQQAFSLLAGVESILGELSGSDLSTELTAFFNAWSELGNKRQSAAVVVQNGEKLASFMRRLRTDLTGQRATIDRQLEASVTAADGLLSQVAELNRQIADAENGGGTASGLRDRRDMAMTELSKLIDVSALEQPDGSYTVLSGSTALVLGATSRGLETRREPGGDQTSITVRVRANGERLDVNAGDIGAYLAGRTGTVDATVESLDALAAALIFEVNKLHSTGANATWLTSTTGTQGVALADRTRAMNDPLNETFAGLPYRASDGGFTLNVRDKATGGVSTVRVRVDLDGLDASGAPGFGADTTPEQIRAAIDGAAGVRASFTPDGRLRVEADTGFEVSFADDSSGVLAVLGVNAYFTGTAANDIAVSRDLLADPSRLMSGRLVNGALVENANALAIARAGDQPLGALGSRSVKQAWGDAAQAVGVRTASAKTNAAASGVVRESLEAQRAAISGVSIDEESLNLLAFQRQYQAAARVIQTADELLQTLIASL